MNLIIPDDILTASEMSEAELKLEIAIIRKWCCLQRATSAPEPK